MSLPDIAISEDEINGLLADLQDEMAATGNADTPAPVAVVATASEPSIEEVDSLLSEVEAAAAPTPAVEAVAEPAKPKRKLKSVEASAPVAEASAPVVSPPPVLKTKITVDELDMSATTSPTYTMGGLDHYVDIDAFKREASVTETNLDQCMVEQSGLRAFYGVQAAKAEAQAARAKTRFEVLEARMYHEHREALVSTGEKVTEKAVEAAVKLDPNWLTQKNLVIEAETISNINRALVQSLSDRRDMIIQLGADRREESKGSPRTTLLERATALGRAHIAN